MDYSVLLPSFPSFLTPRCSIASNATTSFLKSEESWESDNNQKTKLSGSKKQKECHICGKIFNRSYGLERHKLTHTNEKPFKCSFEDCGKSYNTTGNLSRHVKSHSSKDLACPIKGCSLTLRNKSLLKNHLIVHEVETDVLVSIQPVKDMYKSIEMEFKSDFGEIDSSKLCQVSFSSLNPYSFFTREKFSIEREHEFSMSTFQSPSALSKQPLVLVNQSNTHPCISPIAELNKESVLPSKRFFSEDSLELMALSELLLCEGGNYVY